MLHPTFINIVNFFYPLGNTPAVCLTQDLPREQEAKVLLLGCGDVRNILFTCYSDRGIKSRPLDITCCDHESAILARNVLLFTLIVDYADGLKDTSIWNIYHHLFLDDEALELLYSQTQKLISFSASIQNWHQCKYGKVLRMCDQGTLARVRKTWKSYGGLDLSEKEKVIYRKHLESRLQRARDKKDQFFGQGTNLTGFRSAAPIGNPSMTDLPELFNHFWTHGITDKDCDSLSKSKLFNPMFFGSLEDTLILHYGTDPLLGFHLATAYAPLTSNSPLKSTENSTLHRVVAAARLQFREWSGSFRKNAQEGLIIRFFAGDAIAFCHTLQHKDATHGASESNWYRDSNHMEPLILDGEDYASQGNAPLSFNVIDTSNLLDHLGAINILVATAPLLQNSISATIYTEVLVKNHEDMGKLVDSILCGHFPTISILFGLVPIEFWTNSTAFSTADETLFGKFMKSSGQMHSRLSWKRQAGESNAVPTVHFDGTDLAHILYQFYLKMFKHEDLTLLISKIDMRTIQNSSLLHYHRGSLVSFLCFIKEKVVVDWNEVMSVFMGLVQSNSTLLVGMNYIQELYVQLYILGLYSVPAFMPSLDRTSHFHSLRGISTWKDIPAVVCITVKIPRVRLGAITNASLEELGSPILQCSLQSSNRYRGQPFHNIFAGVQLAFGEVSTSGSRNDDTFDVKISEDTYSWNGHSALIVSFVAPSWVILLEPHDATVAFGIQVTPQSSRTFRNHLEPELDIYKTNLGNENNVYMTKFRPNHPGHASVCNFKEFRIASNEPVNKEISSIVKANVDPNKGVITSFTGRLDIFSEVIQSSLRNGAAVETVQITPYIIGVAIGKDGLKFNFWFPAPVMGSRSKTRIARKSSYVELKVPMADPREGNGIPHLMYPTFPSGRSPVAWNMPRLDLDCLPIFDTSKKKEMEWLTTHTTLMFSSRERHLREKSIECSDADHKDARVDFKDSLFTMFMRVSGLHGKMARAFGICNPEDGGVHILVFVSSLRLDLANHTVVMDAAILPLQLSLVPKLKPFLQNLRELGLCTVNVKGDELRLWKEILPAWVERCRQWEHRPSCEYIENYQIPLSIDFGQNPICSCGEGVLPPNTTFDFPRWDLAAKHFVRAAISPSFSVEFVEQSYDGIPTEEPKAHHKTGCKVCGKSESDAGKGLLTCSRCQIMKYCSTECQRKDWKEHKKVCNK